MILLDQPSFGRAPVRTVLSARAVGMSAFAEERGVRLGMSRIHSACPNSDRCDGLVADDVLFRQEPDEEEEEDEGDGKDDDDDHDTDDDGYSE